MHSESIHHILNKYQIFSRNILSIFISLIFLRTSRQVSILSKSVLRKMYVFLFVMFLKSFLLSTSYLRRKLQNHSPSQIILSNVAICSCNILDTIHPLQIQKC